MSTSVYRFFTVVYILGALASMYNTLAMPSTGISGMLAFIPYNFSQLMILIYLIWRHYEALTRKLPFLPPSLTQESPWYFVLGMIGTWFIFIGFCGAVFISLISLWNSQPGMPGALVGGMLLGMAAVTSAQPALFLVEIGVWYYRGKEDA